MRLWTTILSQAWEITRQRRALWRFGFLAALLGSPLLLNAFQAPPLSGDYLQNTPSRALTMTGWQPQTLWLKVFTALPPHTALSMAEAMAVSTLALMLAFYGLSVLGKAALLHSVASHHRRAPLRPSALWAESRRFFWRLFLFPLPATLVFGLAAVSAGVLVGLVAWWAGLVAAVIAVPLLGALVLLAWLLHIYVELGSSAIVLENRTFRQALVQGWKAWKARFWQVVMVALVLSIIQWVIATVLFYLGSILMLALGVLLQMWEATLIPWFLAHPFVLAAASTGLMLSGKLVLAAVLAPVATFVLASWGLLYQALVQPEAPLPAVPAQTRPSTP